MGISGGGDLKRGHRHEQPTLIEHRCAGDGRVRVVIDLRRPDEFAGLRIDRVDACDQVGEVGEGALRRRADIPAFEGDRRAHLGAGTECPTHAAAFFVECIDRAVLAADEHGAHGDGRLRARALGVREGERPFQLELGQIARSELGDLRRDMPLILSRHAPTGFRGRSAQVEGAGWAHAHRRGCAGDHRIERGAGEILGDRTPLSGIEPGGLRLHDALLHREQQTVRRHHLQEGLVGCLGDAALMALGAGAGVRCRPRMWRSLVGLRVRDGCGAEQCGQCDGEPCAECAADG